MFSRSKNSSLHKPRKLHSLEYLKYLYYVLQKNCETADCNADEVVECLRLFSEIIVWGDQNDGSIMDFFWEQNALELLIRYIERQQDRIVCIQLLQTLNILFENLTNNRSIYYLLSQNHTNGIILHDFDFNDEEIIGYYIAFLKSLTFRMNEDTINFFYDEAHSSFPVYQRALQFFNHSENMVRIAVRTITLNIFKVRHVPCSLYVYAHTSVPYFSHLMEEVRKTACAINESLCLTNRLASRGHIADLVAETGDHLHYIDDIFALGIPDLTNVLILVLLQRLLLPVYVYSLIKRHPPSCLNSQNNDKSKDASSSSRGSYLFHAVAMFLLAEVFTILHQPELIRVLTEAILIGDLTLLPSPPPFITAAGEVEDAEKRADPGAPATEGGDVLVHLRAAHHGKRAIRCMPPGSRLQSFLKTIAACGAVNLRRGGGGEWPVSSNLDDDIARCSECIRNYLNGGRNQSSQSSNSPASPQSLSEFTTQIAVPPTGVSPPTPRQSLIQSLSSTLATQENGSGSDGSGGGDGESFSLTGKPFLRALFRSLEVGPGTDYDTFFALSLLIAIKQNGVATNGQTSSKSSDYGLDEGTLALAQLHTPTPDLPCNFMLITKLLDIISDAAKMGSRVRVATLNLALFLFVLVTRDASHNCQLTDNHRQQLEAAFLESRAILADLYLTEPDFADIFEYEVCRFRSQKLSPSKLLENTAFLFSHADDALKLFSNRSEENLTELRNSNDPTSLLVTPLQPRGPLEGPPYTALPFSQLEHIQRIIAVYICLHGYLCEYVFTKETSAGEPLNEVTSPALERIPAFASFGDIPPSNKVLVPISCSIDTSEHRLFGCEVEQQNGRSEKRYLIITDVQFISIIPSHRKMGFGIVAFCGLIQDTELRCDPADDCVLNIVVYKPGDRSGLTIRRIMTEAGIASSSPLPNVFPSMNAKLRFCTSFQCSVFHRMLTHSFEKIVAAKQEKLKQLLNVSDKPTRPGQFLLSEESSNQSHPHSPPVTTKPLRTTGSAPTTLLQKARAYSLSSTAAINSHASDASHHSTASKTTEEMQAIAMVDLSR
ncbi:protein clec16a [Echinococcus multilocularis]|uniref:Protein clec16a n=1 Tax=Echinococcus multilocularis TaxID=6211 RepID=A0A087VXA7_ECHMU|nr:protein clec16a [Echinococcus multilocularis]